MSQDRRYNSYRSSYSGTPRKSRRRKKKQSKAPIIAGLGIIALLLCVIGFRSIKDKLPILGGDPDQESSLEVEESTTAAEERQLEHNVVIDLAAIMDSGSGIADDSRIHVKGMNAAELSEEISKHYKWSLALVNDKANVGDVVKPHVDIDQTTEDATLGDAENPDAGDGSEESYSEISVSDMIEVPDYIAERIPAFVDEVFSADKAASESEAAAAELESSEEETTKKKKKSKETESSEEETTQPEPEVVYTFEFGGYDDKLAELAHYAADMWYVEPLGGSIGSYDSNSDTFVMENARSGYLVDRDKILADLRSAIGSKEFEEKIPVTGTVLNAEDSANVSGAYKTLASFTTNTTSNSVRNKNIQLACRKLNGAIVRPGEEFSFNNRVGQRTKEAGYGEAAAYNNGEVVQEVGGGVCQVSTTLYNAVVKAGLKTTYRQSHTFKPSYVTPGQDATVSWGGPDFRFANLPSKPSYSYDSNYAIGIRASYSNQTVTVSIYGRPVLKEGYTFALSSVQTKTIEKVRQLIEPGSDKQPTNGSEGSVWETRLVIKKDGEVISNDVDHHALYTGHIEYYTDETSSESESESLEDGLITDDPAAQGPGGPLGPGGPGVGPGVIVQPTEGDNPDQGPAAPSAAETTAGSSGQQSPGSPDSPSVSTDNSPGSPAAPDSGSSSGTDNSPSSGTDNSPSSGTDNSPSSNSPGSPVSAPGDNVVTDGPGSSGGGISGPIISSDGPGSLSTGNVSTGGPGA